MNKPEFSKVTIYRNNAGKPVGIQAVIANSSMVATIASCDDNVKQLLKLTDDGSSTYGMEYTPVVIVYDSDDDDTPRAKVRVIDDEFGASDVLAKVGLTPDEQAEFYNELNKYLFAEKKTTITEFIEDAEDESDDDDEEEYEDYNEEWS